MDDYEEYKKEIKAKSDYEQEQEINEADEMFYDELDFEKETSWEN